MCAEVWLCWLSSGHVFLKCDCVVVLVERRTCSGGPLPVTIPNLCEEKGRCVLRWVALILMLRLRLECPVVCTLVLLPSARPLRVPLAKIGKKALFFQICRQIQRGPFEPPRGQH